MPLQRRQQKRGRESACVCACVQDSTTYVYLYKKSQKMTPKTHFFQSENVSVSFLPFVFVW